MSYSESVVKGKVFEQSKSLNFGASGSVKTHVTASAKVGFLFASASIKTSVTASVASSYQKHETWNEEKSVEEATEHSNAHSETTTKEICKRELISKPGCWIHSLKTFTPIYPGTCVNTM